MKMRTAFALVFACLVLPMGIQSQIDPETIREVQRTVCAIKLIDSSGNTVSLGCGVVLRTRVKNQTGFFVATAYHIVKGLVSEKGSSLTISVFDKKGNIFKSDQIRAKHIVWSNPAMDAALLVLTGEKEAINTLPEKYDFPGPASLKLISEPTWGQEIYLFGYRWLNEDRFIDIVKKGILSVGTKELPGYEGHLIYLIDNMANRGMSGGLAFIEEGTGIGIISSYVYEQGGTFNSEDLSVCLPLTIFFNAMASVVISHGDKIINLMNESYIENPVIEKP